MGSKVSGYIGLQMFKRQLSMEIAKSPEYFACPDLRRALCRTQYLRRRASNLPPLSRQSFFTSSQLCASRLSVGRCGGFLFHPRQCISVSYPASKLSPKLYALSRLCFRTGEAGIPGAGRHGRGLHARGSDLRQGHAE
jgi:hypothetical protein